MSDKIKVIVFGGCGFIGRHIVSELFENDDIAHIRVIDKVPPQMAWLNERHSKIFKDSKVSFKSANLIISASCEASFGDDQYDWVINAAGETKPGLDELVYKEGVLKVSENCVRAAAARNVKIYLEISSGHFASSEKNQFKENDECSPWSTIGKYKYATEKAIKEIPGLNWIIVRPAIVYGEGDRLGLTPRLIVGAIFRHLGSTMKLLWDENLKINTIHVRDLSRAIIWLCQKNKIGETYHLVDEGMSTQGSVTKIICNIFNIEHEFCGSILSKLAMSEGTSVVQLANEKHLEPWAKMCMAKNLSHTPLTPYIDIDALSNKHLYLDGSKIRNDGFVFSVPKPTENNLKEVLDDFISMNLLPCDIYSSKEVY